MKKSIKRVVVMVLIVVAVFVLICLKLNTDTTNLVDKLKQPPEVSDTELHQRVLDYIKESTLPPDSPFAPQNCCYLAGITMQNNYNNRVTYQYICDGFVKLTENRIVIPEEGYDYEEDMWYQTEGDQFGAKSLSATLCAYDINNDRYVRERFGVMTDTLLKNVIKGQIKVIYNDNAPEAISNDASRIIDEINNDIVNAPITFSEKKWKS
ncbi:MAG: hypothetical protein HQK93_06470 [Nitrospirae bacterium]|nr:hypothetical protein [Nitrospirota bacterium]